MGADATYLSADFSPDLRLLRTIRALVRSWCRDAGLVDDVEVRGLLVAVTEIATNAMSAHARVGSVEPITVECRAGDDALTVSVSDTGQGFDDAVMGSVTRGERVPDTDGLGVGLQLATSLVSDLQIETTPAGTRVTVTVERATAGHAGGQA